ncbi:unnamed protein product [Peniophora sp. CBMAI 1063]|nr:unnamed protein product [Peniophora sp. CBMAI 1063]
MPADAPLAVLSPPAAHHRVYERYSDDDEEDAGAPWMPTLPPPPPPPAEAAARYERPYEGAGMRYGAGEDEDDSEEEAPYVPPMSAPTPSRALTRSDVQPVQYRSEDERNFHLRSLDAERDHDHQRERLRGLRSSQEYDDDRPRRRPGSGSSFNSSGGAPARTPSPARLPVRAQLNGNTGSPLRPHSGSQHYPAYDDSNRRIGIDRRVYEHGSDPAARGLNHYPQHTQLYRSPSPAEFSSYASTQGAQAPMHGQTLTSSRQAPASRRHSAGDGRLDPRGYGYVAQPGSNGSALGSSLVAQSPSIVLRPISPSDSYTGHSPSSTPGPPGDPDGEAAAAHLRALLQLEPGAPINLYSLEDPLPGHKPNFPLPTLIKLAIFGSPFRRLTLQEIYTELENRFEWFRLNTHDTAWKNSIRHNLSLRKCFVKTSRTMTEPGKGSYWSLDVTQGEGNKRERKRNKKPTKAQVAAQQGQPRTTQHFMAANFAPLQHPLQSQQYPQGATVFLPQSLQTNPQQAAAAHPYQYPPPLHPYTTAPNGSYAIDPALTGLMPDAANDPLAGYNMQGTLIHPPGLNGSGQSSPLSAQSNGNGTLELRPLSGPPPPHMVNEAFRLPPLSHEPQPARRPSPTLNPFPRRSSSSSSSASERGASPNRLAPIGPTSGGTRPTLPSLSQFTSQHGEHPLATALGVSSRSVSSLTLPPPTSFLEKDGGNRNGTAIFGAPKLPARKSSGWLTRLENGEDDDDEYEYEDDEEAAA